MNSTRSAGLLTAILILQLAGFSGCYLEQGKLHFDELNLDPITVYQMAPLETTIYCLAEADLPDGPKLQELHARELAALERDPEQANWGKLVCLALAEQATVEQLQETRNGLQLVIALNRRQANPARGFKRLIEQRLRLYEELESAAAAVDQARSRCREAVEQQQRAADDCRKQLSAERERLESLQQQVQKLKEIELLLHPKNE